MTFWQKIPGLLAGTIMCLGVMITPTQGQGGGARVITEEKTTRFLSTMADFPLLAGMVEIQHSAITFDQPDLYYHQVQLLSWQPIEVVRHSYQQILPQLGWQMTLGGFQRNQMTLSFQDRGLVRLTDNQQKAWLLQLEFSRKN